jgi:hypothetical protein
MKVPATKKTLNLVMMWIVSIAVLLLAYFVVIFPIHLAVSRKSREVSEMSAEIKRMRKYVSDENFIRLKERQMSLGATLDGFAASSLKAGECTYAIADVAANVGLADFTTKQKTTKELSQIQNCQFLKRSLVDVSCNGSYIKFLHLVNEYERSSPVVLIDKFSVNFIQDGSNEIKMSLLILVDNQTDDIKL